MRAKITWSEEERKTLIDKVTELRQRDVVSSLISLLPQAQQLFPEKRRRPVKTIGTVPWLEEGVLLKLGNHESLIRNEGLQKKVIDLEKELSDLKEEIELVQTYRDEEIATAKKEVREEYESSSSPTVKSALRDLGIALERFLPKASEQPVSRIAVKEESTEKKVEKRIVLPKIGVCGLLPGQENIIASSYRGRAELKFVPTDDLSRDLPTVDWMFIITKFISHKQQYRIFETYPREKVILVSGGLSSLKIRMDAHVLRGVL